MSTNRVFKGRRAKRARPKHRRWVFMTTASAILITIPLSHYCEKARWALDRVALSYREEPHAPLLHRLATQRNEAGTVPVLVHGSRRFIDSTDILVHADAVCGGDLLYPRDAALRARG